MDELEIKIEVIYEFFYRKISKSPDWDFNPTIREKVAISNFAKKLKKYYLGSLDNEWFFLYFAFSFLYWKDKYTRLGTGGLAKIEWIIGEAAILRWGARPAAHKFFIHLQISKKYNIYKEDIDRLFNVSPNIPFTYDIFKWHDKERKRFFNQSQGLIHCMKTTTLYDQYSSFCLMCNFKEECNKVKQKINVVN